MSRWFSMLGACAAVTLNATALEVIDADFCVYGGTSGGVAAAVAAARLGKSVVIAEFGRHLGGMTSGGLGQTDTGNKSTIGGISREFYRRIGQHYGVAEQFTFEPHAAEQAFSNMLAEVNVPVYFQSRLASVTKQGARLTQITMENGRIFRAKMFLDATYEGDLLARAGVSYVVGREGTNVFGESLNGIRPSTPSHQFTVNVDPYLTPGDTNSGLLPYIQPGDGGTPGGGDARVQAYNFRLCLTQNATNKMPIAPPPGYDPARYELLARYIEARVAASNSLTLGSFMGFSTTPNGKTDNNNNGAFSTDFIGMNYAYPDADYATRAQIWQDHENYIRGFLTFLATSPRVPVVVRTNMQSWGLCRDEFPDTGGWPNQLYVREARRMQSGYIITQADCKGTRLAADSVGLASYNMDSHNCQRVLQGGWPRNEGDVQQAPAGPFPISYRSIVPSAAECENLFVTFCLSGSHIAFSSCRMEPVFMMTSHSAGTAAAFAIDGNVPVQQVNYEKLRAQLLADGQVLDWGTSSSTNTIIVDNGDGTNVFITGLWTNSTSTAGYWSTNYIHDGNTGKGAKSVRFVPNLPAAGIYSVSVRWTATSNRATNVPVDVVRAAATNTFFVNQQSNGGQWVLLLTTNFTAGTNASVLIRTAGTSGYVIADAVQFAVPGADLPVVNILAADASAAEWLTNTARFTVLRTGGDTNDALLVNYSVSGTASNGVDYLPLSGSVTIPPGALATNILVTPVPDNLVEGPETITLTLATNAGYLIGSLAAATAVLADTPFAEWQHEVFTAGQIQNPGVSGPTADPNHNGLPNSMEYLLALDSLAPNTGANSLPRAEIRDGSFTLTLHRRKAATDYLLVVEASADLADWTTNAAALSTSVVADDGTVETIEVRLPVQNASRGFLRVKVVPR